MILDKLDRLGDREKVGLGIAVFCLLALLGDYFVVRVVAERSRDLDAQMAEEQERLLYHRGVLQREQRIGEIYRQVIGLLDRSETPAETRNRMLGQIDDLARQTGLSVVSMKDRDPESNTYHEEYFVEIEEFRGSMENVLDFLNAVRQAPGMLRVVALSLSPNRGGPPVKGSMLITKVTVSAGTTG